MACGGCRKNGNSSVGAGADLRKFAFLSPRQLRLLKAQEAAEKAAKEKQEAEE